MMDYQYTQPRGAMPLPGIISSQIARHLPETPLTHGVIEGLHKKHVERLSAAWGSLLQHYDLDRVMIHSGQAQLSYSRDDRYGPMVVTPHFAHWTPYGETPALLIIEAGTKPRLVCETHSSFWEGPGTTVAGWDRGSFQIEEMASLTKLEGQGANQRTAYIGDDVKLAFKLGLDPAQCNRQDVLTAADSFRTLKSEYEVACMLRANQMAALGHQRLRDLFNDGEVSEFELHLAYLLETKQTDLTVPYSNIVALGDHCGILHHVHYDQTKTSASTSLLVDAGAQYHHYAADITRTWVRGQTQAAATFKALIQKLDTAQQLMAKNCTVGKPYEDLHNSAHDLIGVILKESGLVTCAPAEAVSSGITRLFFPHGLGHSLGIQVHDVGMKLTPPAKNNPYLRNTSVITAGQVVTIEPGVYFIPSLISQLRQGSSASAINWSLVDELMPFGGIRIEDNILATATGPLSLTQTVRCSA